MKKKINDNSNDKNNVLFIHSHFFQTNPVIGLDFLLPSHTNLT
jgi:hypothetical protein